MGELRVYRVEFDASTPPEGWNHDMATDHPRFALWSQSGDGYTEPRDPYICETADGVPYWSPPSRRNFLSKSSATAMARELDRMGVPHKLLRSLPVEFEGADRG